MIVSPGRLFIFNPATMTNCQNQDNHVFVLDVTQYPIVEPVKNTCLNRPIQFSQLPFSNVADLNCPIQALLSIVSVVCAQEFVIGLAWPVPNPHCHLSIVGSLPVRSNCGCCRGFWRADPSSALNPKVLWCRCRV